MTLVPKDFVLPDPPRTDAFRLTLLGPEHNESDYAAWTGSIDVIRALPGWAGSSWPAPMSLAENLDDCRTHARRSQAHEDFAYTVLRPDRDEVIGCVYLKPTRPPAPGAVDVRSWVTAGELALDRPLYRCVLTWLTTSWPFTEVRYAVR